MNNFQIKESDRTIGVINQYGNDMSDKQLRQLGIGGAKIGLNVPYCGIQAWYLIL